MLQLDAADVLNIATTGVGASALAARWNSPVLVDVNEHTLSALLDHADLLKALEQIEDFRNLANMAQRVVTSTSRDIFSGASDGMLAAWAASHTGHEPCV